MNNFEAPERITFKHLWEMIRSVLNFERGLPFTFWSFLVRPGETTNEYLFGNRRKFMDPIKFLFLAAAIATFCLVNYVDMGDQFIDSSTMFVEEGDKEEVVAATSRVLELFGKYYNVFLFLNVPFYALMTKWLYKKKDYYLAEHLAINTYLYGTMTYLMPLMVIIPSAWQQSIMSVLSLVISAYLVWAYKRIFEEDWRENLWKGIMVLVVASFLYFMILFFIMGIIAGYEMAVSK